MLSYTVFTKQKGKKKAKGYANYIKNYFLKELTIENLKTIKKKYINSL